MLSTPMSFYFSTKPQVKVSYFLVCVLFCRKFQNVCQSYHTAYVFKIGDIDSNILLTSVRKISNLIKHKQQLDARNSFTSVKPLKTQTNLLNNYKSSCIIKTGGKFTVDYDWGWHAIENNYVVHLDDMNELACFLNSCCVMHSLKLIIFIV